MNLGTTMDSWAQWTVRVLVKNGQPTPAVLTATPKHGTTRYYWNKLGTAMISVGPQTVWSERAQEPNPKQKPLWISFAYVEKLNTASEPEVVAAKRAREPSVDGQLGLTGDTAPKAVKIKAQREPQKVLLAQHTVVSSAAGEQPQGEDVRRASVGRMRAKLTQDGVDEQVVQRFLEARMEEPLEQMLAIETHSGAFLAARQVAEQLVKEHPMVQDEVDDDVL